MTLRSIDLQSDGDLDSIRNSCDVYSEACIEVVTKKHCDTQIMVLVIVPKLLVNLTISVLGP